MDRFGYARYTIQDAYISEEVRFLFRTAESPQDRIEVLKDIVQNGGFIDYGLAALAVRDSSPVVRHWFARNTPTLDFSHHFKNKSENVPEDANIKEFLSKDPEPLVAAAVYENPEFLRSFVPDPFPRFVEANHFKRLALMRNPQIHIKIVKAAFEPDDTSLNVTKEERLELIAALFSNTKFLVRGSMSANRFVGGWEGKYHVDKDFQELVDAAEKWPKDSWVRTQAACSLPVSAEEKIKIYQECENSVGRTQIINSCDRSSLGLLKIAESDKDEFCREAARERLSFLKRPLLEYWDREDWDGWISHGFNRSLSSLHPHVALLNDDNYSDGEKINQIKRLSFFIFERLRSSDELQIKGFRDRNSILNQIVKWTVFAAAVAVLWKFVI